MKSTQRAELEDKGKILGRKSAHQEMMPQHQEGPFAANLQLGDLNAGTVGRMQRTVGNKATRRLIHRKSLLEEKILGSSKGGGSQIPQSSGNEPGTQKDISSAKDASKQKTPSVKINFEESSGSGPQSAQGSATMGGPSSKMGDGSPMMGESHLTPAIAPFPSGSGTNMNTGDGQSAKMGGSDMSQETASSSKMGGSDLQEDKTVG